MMDKLLKVLLAVVLSVGLAGCYGKTERVGAPAPAAGMQKTIAVLPASANDPFWNQFHEGANKAAEAAGFRLRWESPPPVWNPKTQSEMMRTVINLNPPGIVLGPLNRNLLQPALVDAVKLNIPVIVAASNEDTAYQMAYIGSDNAAMGVDLAREAGGLVSGKGKVLLVNVQEGMRSVDLREHSLLQTLSRSFPNVQVEQTQFPEDENLNYEKTNLQLKIKQSLLQSLRNETEIKAVITLDENSTGVAWQTIKTIPESNRPLLIGVSVREELIAAAHKGKIAALVAQDASKIGSESIKAIISFKNGNRPPKQVLIPYKIIRAGSSKEGN